MPYPYSELSFEKRKEAAQRLLQKNPGYLPVLIDLYGDTKRIHLEKRKFLIHEEAMISRMLCEIRKRSTLAPDEGVFLFCDNILLVLTETVGNLYRKYARKDGFLYLQLSVENTFG